VYGRHLITRAILIPIELNSLRDVVGRSGLGAIEVHPHVLFRPNFDLFLDIIDVSVSHGLVYAKDAHREVDDVKDRKIFEIKRACRVCEVKLRRGRGLGYELISQNSTNKS
jgi:hypothetical protein